jgi:hypothetical protein
VFVSGCSWHRGDVLVGVADVATACPESIACRLDNPAELVVWFVYCGGGVNV